MNSAMLENCSTRPPRRRQSSRSTSSDSSRRTRTLRKGEFHNKPQRFWLWLRTPVCLIKEPWCHSLHCRKKITRTPFWLARRCIYDIVIDYSFSALLRSIFKQSFHYKSHKCVSTRTHSHFYPKFSTNILCFYAFMLCTECDASLSARLTRLL